MWHGDAVWPSRLPMHFHQCISLPSALRCTPSPCAALAWAQHGGWLARPLELKHWPMVGTTVFLFIYPGPNHLSLFCCTKIKLSISSLSLNSVSGTLIVYLNATQQQHMVHILSTRKMIKSSFAHQTVLMAFLWWFCQCTWTWRQHSFCVIAYTTKHFLLVHA